MVKGYEDVDWKAGASDEGSFSPTQLFTGDDPIHGRPFPVAEGEVLEFGTIVSLNANGEVIPWDPPNAVTLPAALNDVVLGVVATAIDTYDGPYPAQAHIWETGCFNPDLLIWPAVINTWPERNAAIAASGARFRVKRLA